MKSEVVGTFALMLETDEALAQPGEAGSLVKLAPVGQRLVPLRLAGLSRFCLCWVVNVGYRFVLRRIRCHCTESLSSNNPSGQSERIVPPTRVPAEAGDHAGGLLDGELAGVG